MRLDFVWDAFGYELRPGMIVVWSGRDEKDRLTHNRGVVSELDSGRVRITRTDQSTSSGLRTGVEIQRQVWVDLWKVSRVN